MEKALAPLLRPTGEIPEHITKEEKDRIIDFLEKTQPKTRRQKFLRSRNIALVETLWHTGISAVDAVNLKFSDVDDEKKLLTYTRKKTGVPVTVTVTDRFLFVLLNYYHKWKNVYLKDERFFPITRQQVYNIVRFLGKTVLGKKLHPHMFRHGLVMHAIKHNVHVRVIAARLGHKDPMTTIRMYGIVTPEMQRFYFDQIL